MIQYYFNICLSVSTYPNKWFILKEKDILVGIWKTKRGGNIHNQKKDSKITKKIINLIEYQIEIAREEKSLSIRLREKA